MAQYNAVRHHFFSFARRVGEAFQLIGGKEVGSDPVKRKEFASRAAKYAFKDELFALLRYYNCSVKACPPDTPLVTRCPEPETGDISDGIEEWIPNAIFATQRKDVILRLLAKYSQ